MEKRHCRTIQIIGIVLVLICFEISYFHQYARVHEIEVQLQKEYAPIVHPKNSILKDIHSSQNINDALVSAKFVSPMRFEEIRDYYNGELTKYGWKFSTEREIKDWGKDLGGKVLEFNKGIYELTIQYAGDRANYGWSYSIGVSWGLK